VFRGAITFRNPARGRAVLSLTARDFSNFLVHPLLGVAPLPSGAFTFERDYCTLDPARAAVYFSGVWHGEHVIVEARQPVPFGRIEVAVADAPRLTPRGAETLSADMTRYFNEVVLEMDGTFLSFSDMRVGGGGGGGSDDVYGGGGEPTIQVTVDLTVHRVPNPRSMNF
jgi:hypothetical protein